MNHDNWHGIDEYVRTDVGPDEGWFYSFTGKRIVKNPPGSPPNCFTDDDEAIAFVKQRAEEGSAFHRAALVQQIKVRLLK